MSKVDFGRINAENEDFFSRKTQKNEGAKKGDEFLFDDEFDNKHVSNNERAGGDRFDHEHHVDPKEEVTSIESFIPVSDSDEDTTTESISSIVALSDLTPEEIDSILVADTGGIDNGAYTTTFDENGTRTETLNEGYTEETTSCTIDGYNGSYTVAKDSDGNIAAITFDLQVGSNTFHIFMNLSEGASMSGGTVNMNSDGSYSSSASSGTSKDLAQDIFDYAKNLGLLSEDQYDTLSGLLAAVSYDQI